MGSVLDLPQLWQRPSFDQLLLCLRSLEIKPSIWVPGARSKNGKRGEEHRSYSAHNAREIAIYLSGIIKSSLQWLDSEEEKEIIWDETCKRIAERSGRAAMGTMTRSWPFLNQADSAFELSILEPAFTGDSLGHKTWGSSYMLALDLPRLASGSLSHLFNGTARPSVLELGSGTGLLGIAAAAIWKTHVVLSDLPDIMPNLLTNVEKNREAVEKLGGSLSGGVLTWGSDHEFDKGLFGRRHQHEIILAADSLYDDIQPDLLYAAIMEHVSLDVGSAVVVIAPQRDQATTQLTAKFRVLMETGLRRFVCVEEGELDQLDDWGSGDDEDSANPPVKCWWGVFRYA
ncbi:Protein-lysine N-methyltransferase rrg1 [Ceratocystis pirilliformis]|uniref:Protein-lysine N-methyltransferase rrg1 n=1 Tax=Ceratocystis pirilliformis TaxID=259994 RepID=A0ABR3Z3L7_9PEZI